MLETKREVSASYIMSLIYLCIEIIILRDTDSDFLRFIFASLSLFIGVEFFFHILMGKQALLFREL